MSHIKSLLKPQSVTTLTPHTTVAEAAELMSGKRIGSVLVMHDNEIAGIFTERDLLNKVVALGHDPKMVKLSEVYTSPVATVSPNNTAEECFRLMKKIGCRHLPVLDNGRLVAIVSIRDVLGWVIQQLEFERDQLKHYIEA